MFALLVGLATSIPAHAPAPVPRDTSSITRHWAVVSMRADTLTLKRDGSERVFSVAKDVAVTMNGRKGYTFVDMGELFDFYQPKVAVTMSNGVAIRLDVSLTLPKGQRIWEPGMGPVETLIREARVDFIEREARKRRGNP